MPACCLLPAQLHRMGVHPALPLRAALLPLLQARASGYSDADFSAVMAVVAGGGAGRQP